VNLVKARIIFVASLVSLLVGGFYDSLGLPDGNF